ncbi:uncharacterized protein LOC116608999 isoform X2 [Nematostella vectensis]|nr:uncharacterized protein LOC116608999 isoform X2 [Nematostella vectensis]
MSGHMLQKKGYPVLYFHLNAASCLYEAAIMILSSLGQTITDKPVHQVKQLLKSLDEGTTVIFDNTEELQGEIEEKAFLGFLKYLGQYTKVCTIVATRKPVHNMPVLFPFKAISKPLKPLEKHDAVQLLHALEPRLDPLQADSLYKCCQGVPWLLKFIASLLKNSDLAAVEPLIRELRTNPEVLQEDNSPDLKQYFSYLKIFMNHLPRDLKEALIRFAVFPSSFTSQNARFLFKENTTDLGYTALLSRLVDYSLLSLDTQRSVYELHPQVQAYCRTHNGDADVSYCYSMANTLFIQHFLRLLQDLHIQFISEESKLAMDCYSENKLNIDYALKLSATHQYLRHFGIDISTEVVNFLAKVLNIKEFEKIYWAFENTACSLKDFQRQSDCLTSIGFKLVCYHGKRNCREALKELSKAEALQALLCERVGREEVAHCKSKLGLCLAWSGDVEKGIRMIAHGIQMRKRVYQAQPGNIQQMLIGGGFCDLAMALSSAGRHKSAATIWSSKCLPIYSSIMGEHPFTATLLQYIGDAYHQLKEGDLAIDYKRKSLAMRRKLLGVNHPDTARSHACLALTLSAIQQDKEALDHLRASMQIQIKVLASPEDISLSQQEIWKVSQNMRQELCVGFQECSLGNCDGSSNRNTLHVKHANQRLGSHGNHSCNCCHGDHCHTSYERTPSL